MRKKDIVINGVSLKQHEAQRLSIREGAIQMISDNIEIAKDITQQLLKLENKEEMEKLADQAYEALETAHYVSDISNLDFDLPYSGQDDQYEYSEVFSHMLENEISDENFTGKVRKLYNLFSEMEMKSRDWNASNC